MTGDDQLPGLLGEIAVGGGSDAAWERLVALTGDDLRRTAGRITGDAQLAADAVQDTLLHVRRGAGRFRTRGGDPAREARAWLWRVAACAALDQLRSRSRRVRYERRGSPPSNAEEPSASVERAEIALLVRAELARLPAAQREALTLRYVVGLDVTEVATALAVPEGTAKSHLHRGLERLRGRLAGRGLALAAIGLASALRELPAAQMSIIATTVPTTAIAAGGTFTMGTIIMASTLFVTLALAAVTLPSLLRGADAPPVTVKGTPAVAVPLATAPMPGGNPTSISIDQNMSAAEDVLASLAVFSERPLPPPPWPIDTKQRITIRVRKVPLEDAVRHVYELASIQRIASADRMRHIMIYAIVNCHERGAWAADLASIDPHEIPKTMLISPGGEGVPQPHYVYVRPVLNLQSRQPVVIENPACEGGQGANIAFGDGSINWLRAAAAHRVWAEAQRLAALPEAARDGLDIAAWAAVAEQLDLPAVQAKNPATAAAASAAGF